MSQQVDFYLLSDETPEAKLRTACRLAEKAYLAGHNIYMEADSEVSRQQLDELLWTFRDISFVPHSFYGQTQDPQPPVQIGYQQTPENCNDILINLTLSLLPFHSQFQRIIEIIPNDDASKQNGRELYRQYRNTGCELKTHQI